MKQRHTKSQVEKDERRRFVSQQAFFIAGPFVSYVYLLALFLSHVANDTLLTSQRVSYTMPNLRGHNAQGMQQAAAIRIPRYLFRAWSPAPDHKDFGSLTISGANTRSQTDAVFGIFSNCLTHAPTNVAISSWTQSLDHALARASALPNCGDGEVLSILDTQRLASRNVVLQCVNATGSELPLASQAHPEMQDDSRLFRVVDITRSNGFPAKLLIFDEIPKEAWVSVDLSVLRNDGLDELMTQVSGSLPVHGEVFTHLEPAHLQARFSKAIRIGNHFGIEFKLAMTCFVAIPRSRFCPASEQHIRLIAANLAPAYDVPRSWLDVYDPDQTFLDTTQALRLMRLVAEYKYGVHASVVGWDDESRRHMGLMHAGPLQKRGPQGKPYWWRSEEFVGDAKPMIPMKHEKETEYGVMLSAAERSADRSRGGAGSEVVKADDNDAKVKKEEEDKA
ncbi:hypothetical protein LTS10_001047 [Elasticomyces elasticus]|nr:hypothetical protein LTS10_001047 [Elasticomyces elasticus]